MANHHHVGRRHDAVEVLVGHGAHGAGRQERRAVEGHEFAHPYGSVGPELQYIALQNGFLPHRGGRVGDVPYGRAGGV